MNSKQKVKVFVYGTLRKGLPNHQCLQHNGVSFICKDSIRANMYTSHWGYPFIIFSQSNKDRVVGEIYEIPYAVLRGSLDRLEGYKPGRKDCLYFRKKAKTKNGHIVFVYEASTQQANQPCDWITHGNWVVAKFSGKEHGNGIVHLDRAHKKWRPTKIFTNVARKRYYGLRIGDKVSCRNSSLKQFHGEAYVVQYSFGDNNRVSVQVHGRVDTISCVAEWLTLEQKVEEIQQHPDEIKKWFKNIRNELRGK